MTQQIRIGKVLLTKGGKWNADTLYPQLTFVIHNNDGWWSAHANIGSEPSADNHNWVQATDVRSLIEQVTTTLGSLDDFFEAVKAAEAIRVEAEIGRVTAEAKRTEDEETRKASEAQRIENEAARQASETQREEAEALRAEAEDARVHEFDSLRAGIGSELELVKKAVDNADIKAQAAQKAADTALQAAATATKVAENVNDAEDAAEAAAALANEKAALADTKASAAHEAASLATDKAGIAQAAADNANEKAALAQSAANSVDAAKAAALEAATHANEKATLAQEAASLANEKASVAETAAALATEKAGLAQEAASLATEKAGVAQAAANSVDESKTAALAAADNANAKAELAQTAANNADAKAKDAEDAASLAIARASDAQTAAETANAAAANTNAIIDTANDKIAAAEAAAALANEKAGVAQAAADSVDAAIAKVNNFETRLGNVETGKQDDVTKLEEVSEVDYVIGIKDGAAKRISKKNISVETELHGMAWGVILNPNSANAELSVVGNYALWTEFKENIGRYQMNNSGKAIKLHPLDSSKYIDGTDIDTSKGHIMVHVPDLYYKVVEQSNGNSILWMSARPIGGHAIHTSGEGNGSWIGAYIGREVDGALVSKPSLNPTRDKTISSFFATAQVNGPDFGLSDYEHRQLMMMLYLSEYHNENSQVCLGYGMNGNADNWVAGVYNALTGETASLGDGCGSVAFHSDDEKTANACHISLFGIEDPYGWFWEMIQGCYFGNSGNEAQTGSEMFVYKGNRMPTSDELTTQPSGAFRQLTRPTSSGNVYALQMGDHFDVLPGKLGSGGWSDYHWANTTGQLLLWGGYANGGSLCGLAFSDSSSAFSYAFSGIAARLAYYGVATVVTRPTEL